VQHRASALVDETRILSWSDDRTVRLWDAATGAPIGPPMKHDGPNRPLILQVRNQVRHYDQRNTDGAPAIDRIDA
jgi:WD40 repeat protein